MKRAVSFLAIGALLMPIRANAQPKEPAVDQCTEDLETARVERKRGRLVAALEAFTRCTEEQCPSSVRKDCVQGLDAVERAIPTMTIIVRGADGKDLDANLRVDDLRFEAGARPVPIDPGQHTARITLNRIERKTRFSVYEGEKARVLILDVTDTTIEPVEPPPPSREDQNPPPPQPVRLGPVLLGVGGLVCAIVGVGFVSKAEGEREKQAEAERLRDIALGAETGALRPSRDENGAALHQRNADSASSAADGNTAVAIVFGVVAVGAMVGAVVWYVKAKPAKKAALHGILAGSF